MLLWLNGGAEAVASVCSHADRVEALRNIVGSARRGESALFGDRDLLNGLSDSGLFVGGDAAYLRLAAQELTQFGAALSGFTKIRLSTTSNVIEFSGRDWVVPLERFLDERVIGRPLLIGENIRDSRFLLIASTKVVEKIAPGFRCNYLPCMGGGDVTAEVLEEYLRAGGPPFFCVVDSDKKHRADVYGQTSSRCRRVMRNATEGWCFRLSVLEARELENLVPVELRQSLARGMSREHQAAHTLLCALPDSVRMYICLKNGEFLCRFHALGEIQTPAPPEDGCFCAECHSMEACVSVPGFGRLLQRALEYLTDEGGDLPDLQSWPSELREICDELMQFGLARHPMRV